MIHTKPTRDKAIEYIMNPRKEVAIHNDHAVTFRYSPVATHQAGENHWWTVDDVYGDRYDNFLHREVVLWHICFDDGEWCILRWSGSEITRTDCPAELTNMVRRK